MQKCKMQNVKFANSAVSSDEGEKYLNPGVNFAKPASRKKVQAQLCSIDTVILLPAVPLLAGRPAGFA